MVYLKRFIPALFLICWAPIFAQQNKIDSLKALVGSQKGDTNAVNSLNLLSVYNWQTGAYANATEYASRALAMANKLNWPKGISVAHDNLGTINWYKGNYPEALKNHLASLRIKETLGDQGTIAVCFNNIGIVYLYQENFEEALKQYEAALKIFEDKCGKDPSGADKKCLKGLAATINNMGNTYYFSGKPAEAVNWYLRALKVAQIVGDKKDLATSYNNLAIFYEENGNYREAIKNYNAALVLMQETGDKESVIGFYINMGSFYTRIKKYKEAGRFLISALDSAKKIESLVEMKECYADLAVLDSARGNDRGALAWYKLFIGARDSLLNEENTKKTVRLEMNYTFEKKEAATKLEQEKKDAVAESDSKRQRIILWAISAFGILVLIFALFAYRSYLQKQRVNIEITRQKMLIEEKQTEILDSIHYAKRIQTALMPHEKYIQRNLEKLRI